MRMNKSEKIRLLVRISQMYYEENLTQEKIALKFGLSRPRVSRLLDEARKLGFVTISVKAPYSDYGGLESGLERIFGLKEAIITLDEKNTSEDEIKRKLGEAAAVFLERRIREGDIISVSWGTTLREFSNALNPRKKTKIKVVPMIGGIGHIGDGIHCNEIARKVSEAFGGAYYLLHAPVVFPETKAKQAVENDINIREVLRMANKADLAFVGIGTTKGKSVIVNSGYLSKEELAELARNGAVGEICVNFYDKNGTPYNTSLDGRKIGPGLEDLKKIKIVVGVAGGKEKTKAILGALRGGYIDVIITNEGVARELIKIAEKEHIEGGKIPPQRPLAYSSRFS